MGRRARKQWTAEERAALYEAAKQGLDTSKIAKALGRSEGAVTAQAYKLGLTVLT